jgi:hypothetical protein
MTQDELNRLKALCEQATPGPWSPCVDHYEDYGIMAPTAREIGRLGGLTQAHEDAAFIASSRTAMPELIAEVERLTIGITDIRDVLTAKGYPEEIIEAFDYVMEGGAVRIEETK